MDFSGLRHAPVTLPQRSSSLYPLKRKPGGLFTGGLGAWRREKSMAQHKKTHEGLILGNRSFNYPYSHIKCFRVSLFISYLHFYMAMETEHRSTIYS